MSKILSYLDIDTFTTIYAIEKNQDAKKKDEEDSPHDSSNDSTNDDPNNNKEPKIPKMQKPSHLWLGKFMQASYVATLQNLNDWEGNIENIENDALQTFVDHDFAGAVTEFNEAFESLLDKSSDNISKISRHLLLMLVDPGRNPIDDPILFVPGTAEYRDAYSAHLRKFL